jgi:nitrogen-specific signal transduction histidine kinase
MSDEEYGAAAAVIAHQLMGSLSAVTGAAKLLDEAWEHLSAEARRQLLEVIQERTTAAIDSLHDLVQGVPSLESC